MSRALDWRQLAELNRPTDHRTLACAASELAMRGLSESDIADALRLDPGAVRRLLAIDPAAASEAHRAAWSAQGSQLKNQ